MAIVFDTEGGSKEIPDPPPLKSEFSGRISHGPSFTELLKILESYPKVSADFEFSPDSNVDKRQFAFSVWCKIFVFSIRALLMPCDTNDKITIDPVKNEWQIEGFIPSTDGFKIAYILYNTKTHTGYLRVRW